MTPENLLMVNSGETHSVTVPAGHTCSSCSLRLDPKWLSALSRQINGRYDDFIASHQPVIHDPELSLQVLALDQTLQRYTTKLEKEYGIMEIVAKLLKRHAKSTTIVGLGKEQASVLRVCEYLHDCYNENVSLEQLSQIANLSPFHLLRVFLRDIGVPPHSYQLQVRLEKATALLASGRPIVEVAFETGFCDQSHFQKAFKKKFGLTPKQYEY